MENRNVKIVTLCTIVLLMTACAGVEDLIMGSDRPVIIKANDAIVVEENTTSKYDEHRQITEIKGPTIYLFRRWQEDYWMPPEEAEPFYKEVDVGVTLEGMTYFGPGSYYRLRASIKKNKLLTIQLYVKAVVFDQWAFYDHAYSEGEQLDITRIDREVGDCKYGCWMNEDIAINLTLEQLEKLANKPVFNFKLYGKGGEAEYTVNGAYFRGFLKALNTARAS